MRRFITFCMVLAAALCVGYVAWKSSTRPTTNTTDVRSATTTPSSLTDQEIGLQDTVEYETTGVGGLKVELRYPAATNTTVADAISKEIVSIASSTLADYSKSFRECKDSGGTSDACAALGVNPWSLSIEYDTYATERAVSYLFHVYGYYGGAHGSTALMGLTFDRATGERLTLDDFVVPSEEQAFIAALDREIRSFYAASGISDLEYELAEPGSAEFDRRYGSSFFVTKDGVGIGFSSYELGYFALGTPAIVVPYSDF